MKITFPHMGNVYIAVEAFLRGLGHEPVTPPPSSRRTLELGSFHSPAEVCLPFKIALGNMLEGMAQGAEAVLMIGGWCLFYTSPSPPDQSGSRMPSSALKKKKQMHAHISLNLSNERESLTLAQTDL